MRPSPPTHPSNQPSPHSQPPTPHGQMMSSQPFMGPRYPAGPRPVRMPPLGGDFNGVSVFLLSNINRNFAHFLANYSPIYSCNLDF